MISMMAYETIIAYNTFKRGNTRNGPWATSLSMKALMMSYKRDALHKHTFGVCRA